MRITTIYLSASARTAHLYVYIYNAIGRIRCDACLEIAEKRVLGECAVDCAQTFGAFNSQPVRFVRYAMQQIDYLFRSIPTAISTRAKRFTRVIFLYVLHFCGKILRKLT